MLSGKKTVLITGAGGFIGSHLAEECVRRGYSVRALVRYNSVGRRGWLDSSPLIDEIEVVAGDVRDPDIVATAVEEADYVFHLAALIGIPYSYSAPESYVQTNIVGTQNVLRAALKQSVEKLLITSTSEVYGNAQYVPIDENHPVVGQSPYAATKIGENISIHKDKEAV